MVLRATPHHPHWESLIPSDIHPAESRGRHHRGDKPNTPTAMLGMAGGLHQQAQRSHEETTFGEIIGSLEELCQQRGGKSQKKVTLDGDEIWDIIQDLGLEYKDY